ncbi:hypothetical protein AWENTII_004751 [Aspergillus wentii]
MKWECVAVTLPEYQQFLDTIRTTRDADEKILRDTIVEHVLPLLEKEEEAQERKRVKREKELVNLQMLAGAKRSSRIAGKAEKERHEREAAEAARKHEEDLAVARKEQDKQKKLESERQSRMMTREQRIKDREQKRLLHEAELERIAEEQQKLERGESRASERHLKAELERQRKNLQDLNQEDQWIFDCSGCGVHGENLDDGSHSVACEKCSVWQHSKCLGIGQDEAEREDFHFVCHDCKQREEEAKLPKLPPLKFKVGSSPLSAPVAADSERIQESSPTKKARGPVTNPQIGSPSGQPVFQPTLPHPPSSPERRPQAAVSSSPTRAPFSPSKSVNGFTPKEHTPKLPPMQQATHLPPTGLGSFNSSPFQSPRRPSSSHSMQSHNVPSPIQNRPSMSPTQGNRDVGPLAGFPAGAPSNGSGPWTHQTPRPSTGNQATTSIRSRPSFSAATPGSQSSPPQSSHGVPLSGISPTKHSPRPMTSGSIAGAPILPPIQRLEPSPKLMGRSSPDAPIPAPMKCMTPEQEERRQRETALIFQAQGHSQANNGQHGLMSSPSLNRIPPLGPSAVSQQPGSDQATEK